MTSSDDSAPIDFILRHSVFTLEELEEAYVSMGRKPKLAAHALEYHVKEGRIARIRRGLYVNAKTFVDPWLIASKLADSVVISHDGALSFHKLTGIGHQLSFLTLERTPRATCNEIVYRPIRVKHLPSTRYIEEHLREGVTVHVTSIAATLVDCCALLERAPPPLELLTVFEEAKSRVKLRDLISYAVSLRNRLAVSRLAFFLTCARYGLGMEENRALAEHGVKVPTYFHRKQRTDSETIIPKLNLIVSDPLQSLWLRATS